MAKLNWTVGDSKQALGRIKRPKLVDGKIPAHTKCPYKNECEIAQDKLCYHTGRYHDIPYSCATARAFEILERKDE